MSSKSFRERFFSGVPRYECIETLGRGGMGVVYLARDKELDDVVAIKVLQPDFDGTELDLLTRFKREINLNRKIKHPNVARIHDFGLSGEFPYITMEYIPGKDLKAVIQDRGRIPPGEAIAILRQIARGMHAAHEVGIIHRDLKPQNVMIDANAAVAILDFGLARGRNNENLTASSVVLGTPQYLSPEQALGGQADARSDIYSIGIIAFEMLTGDVPFSGDTPVATAMKQVTAPMPDTMNQFPEISVGLKNIVAKALAKRPSDRFVSAADLEAELAMLEPGGKAETGGKAQREPPQAFTLAPQGPAASSLTSLYEPGPSAEDTASRKAAAHADTPKAGMRRLGRPSAQLPVVPFPEAQASLLAPQPPAAVQGVPPSPAPAQHPQPHPPPHAQPQPQPIVPAVPPAFPAAAQVPPTAASQQEAASRREKDKTIVRKRQPVVLVVDADSQALLTSASVLESSGTGVVVARSGPEALELLMRSPADLIFMDIALPGMDGLDVTRIIKAKPELSGIPILLTSSRPDRSLFAFGIQAGAVEVLKKPVPEKLLVVCAWQVLKRLGFMVPAGIGDVDPPASGAPRLPRPSRP